MKRTLIFLYTPDFNCAIILHDDRVSVTPDAFEYIRDWSCDRVRDFCQERGWTVSVVTESAGGRD